MHRAAPVRGVKSSPSPNFRGICRYTPLLRRLSLSPLLSAHTIRARICTFSSYLNFNPCNSCALAPPNSRSFCTCKIPGGVPSGPATFSSRPAFLAPLAVPSLLSSPQSLSLLECMFMKSSFTNSFRMHVYVMYGGWGGLSPRHSPPPSVQWRLARGLRNESPPQRTN